ncbi:hypothetical protein H2O64_08750 [Kordia sp. YSTF-M3]|uniref:Uncharacterized protein n=1 Tax=Kordia aestuariivivens TaxID=2759037 RepID=A0ABR7Q867_9FLAO|nr:hypothetical protein [Kordia aestuariivivens]MBC8754757.1 hypothetical protein [Kordia aestuariivivens]
MNYFKRNWNESRGDEYDNWGKSIWFFETNSNGEVLRQMEVYENGKVLKYDNDHIEDEFGKLSNQKLDLDEFREFFIDKNEFDTIWN